MDIALCSLNKKTKELQFAGAGIPLLIATNHALQKDIECNSIVTNEHNLSLYEVKGNIMPVGSSPRMKPFTNITIPLQNNSVYLYLVTDGFQDQMGGESNKKFGVKNLRNLLLSNANLSSKIQHNGLNTTFEEWRKGFEQIDDVTILGIKI
jgi:serine phosphatase RsbU (regulator of sigma subunit)